MRHLKNILIFILIDIIILWFYFKFMEYDPSGGLINIIIIPFIFLLNLLISGVLYLIKKDYLTRLFLLNSFMSPLIFLCLIQIELKLLESERIEFNLNLEDIPKKSTSNVFYSSTNINLEDTFSIYSPNFHELLHNRKQYLTLFFENDTLKFNSSLIGAYESIQFDGFVTKDNMTIKLKFTDCTNTIDSIKLFNTELKFKNQTIKPSGPYTCEFNIHALLFNDSDSLEVFICGTKTDTIHPSPPKYILDRREWEKQNMELVGR